MLILHECIVVMVLQENNLIFSFLRAIEALQCLSEDVLRHISTTVRYQVHEANDILYW